MASTKFKKIDLNRYRKIYPYVRKEPSYKYLSDKDILLEIGEVTFSDANSGSYTFTETFTSAPTIVGISYDSSENDSANVNIFITSLSTTSVTFGSSQNFTGKVQFHAIWIDS